MNIELNQIATNVENLIQDECFRTQRATEMVWVTFLEWLPLDYEGECSSSASIKLENTIRDHVWNFRAEDEADYISIWAMELLVDVDFNDLAIRKGATPYV